MRTLPCVGLLVVACAAHGDTVPLRVLARPGEVATDGTRLGAFAGLTNARDRLVVRAEAGGLVRVAGDAKTVLIRTGDSLPAPLTGRFDDLGGADVTATGSVIFRASVDSPDIDGGMFELDDAGLRVLSLDVPSARALTTNTAGDVLLSKTTRLARWRRSDSTTTTLARRNSRLPDGARLLQLGLDAALTDDGTVVFTARVRPRRGRLRDEIIGVYRLPPNGTPGLLAQTTARSARLALARPVMAANPRGDVVHILGPGSTTGVFLHPADGTPPVRIAGPGDAVGVRILREPLPGLVAIDDQRRVAFLAQLDDGPHVVLADATGLRSLSGPLAGTDLVGGARLPGSAAVVWRSDGSLFRAPDGSTPLVGPLVDLPPLDPGFTVRGTPGVNRDGTAVVTVKRSGLYALEPGGATPLLRERDVVEGGQVITLLDHAASANGQLVALADLDSGRTTLLLRQEPGGWVPLVADGDQTPLGDTIDLFELPPFDARRDEMVAALATKAHPSNHAPYALRPGTPPVPLANAGALVDVDGVVVLRDSIVLEGYRSEDTDTGLFRLRRGRIRPLASSGQRVGGRRLSAIDALQATGDGLIFRATVNAIGTALFAWRPGAPLQRIDRPSWPSVTTFVGGPRIFAGIGSRDDSAPSALYLLTGRRVRRLAVAGDPSPLGRPLGFRPGNPGELALTRRGVAFLDGSAVLEAPFPRRPGPR